MSADENTVAFSDFSRLSNTTANGTINYNGTQPWDCSFNRFTTGAKIGQTFAYSLIFAVSLAGNIFIGIVVYKTKTMRKPINFLIVNMAMSDMLYPILLFPRQLTNLHANFWLITGPLGQALCKLLPFLRDVSVGVSIQSLVLIAVDRFGAVVLPLRSPLISSRLLPVFILATWIVPMAVCSPRQLFARKLVKYPGGQLVCEHQWNEVFGESSSQNHYILAVYIVIFIIPFLLITILYTMISFKLRTHTVPGEQSANARQQRVKRERNVLKMSLAIVLGFAVCWIPYSIAWILRLFVPDVWLCDFEYFSLVAFFIAQANCAINPCICFIFSGNFRQEIKNLLRCS